MLQPRPLLRVKRLKICPAEATIRRGLWREQGLIWSTCLHSRCDRRSHRPDVDRIGTSRAAGKSDRPDRRTECAKRRYSGFVAHPFKPGVGNRLPEVIGNIRLREHELKSLLAPVERIWHWLPTRPRARSQCECRTLHASLERAAFSNAPGPPTRQSRSSAESLSRGLTLMANRSLIACCGLLSRGDVAGLTRTLRHRRA